MFNNIYMKGISHILFIYFNFDQVIAENSRPSSRSKRMSVCSFDLKLIFHYLLTFLPNFPN